MGNAAYVKKVQILVDGVWLDIPATSPSIEIGGDLLDDTDLATNAGFRTRCYGLNDWSASVDSNWRMVTNDGAIDDSNGSRVLAVIRDAKVAHNILEFRYLPVGEANLAVGLQGQVLVENFGQTGETGGLETVSISLQANGPLAPAA